MKTYLTKAVACAIVMTTCFNCSIEPVEILEQQALTLSIEEEPWMDPPTCVAENPKARVTNNNSTEMVNLEVFDSNGNLVSSAYNINPGDNSGWKSFPVGETTFLITTAVSGKPVTIDMGLCMAYDVTIDDNNQLDTDEPIQL